MKTFLGIAMLFSLVAALTGCVSQRADSLFPEGHASKARYTRTGKFSSTTVEADNFTKSQDKVTADRLVMKHSNVWIPNLEIVVEGYQRVRAHDEASKEKAAQP